MIGREVLVGGLRYWSWNDEIWRDGIIGMGEYGWIGWVKLD